MRINPLTTLQNPALEKLANQAPTGVGGSIGGQKGHDDFASKLMDALKEVNATQQDAAAKQNAFMAGQQVDYHDLMIAVEKASVSMQLTMAVRNKVLDAYSEISRMQI